MNPGDRLNVGLFDNQVYVWITTTHGETRLFQQTDTPIIHAIKNLVSEDIRRFVLHNALLVMVTDKALGLTSLLYQAFAAKIKGTQLHIPPAEKLGKLVFCAPDTPKRSLRITAQAINRIPTVSGVDLRDWPYMVVYYTSVSAGAPIARQLAAQLKIKLPDNEVATQVCQLLDIPPGQRNTLWSQRA